MERQNKHNYYLDIAETVIERSSCIRRKFGAIIVKNDEIISTGYNGAPRGRKNCCDEGYCIREKLNVPRGTKYELCRSVHAEANAIISAPRKDMIGATLYLACHEFGTEKLVPDTNSCPMCKRLVINAGIKNIIVRDDKENYREIQVDDWIKDDESVKGVEGY